MLTEAQILDGFSRKLVEASIVDESLISFPNVEFTEPEVSKNSKWLRLTMLPAETASFGLGHNNSNQHFGLVQISVFMGLGISEYAMLVFADDIVSAFKRGTVIDTEDFRIKINTTPFRLPMLLDTNWAMLPVRIPYLCFAPNPA